MISPSELEKIRDLAERWVTVRSDHVLKVLNEVDRLNELVMYLMDKKDLTDHGSEKS